MSRLIKCFRDFSAGLSAESGDNMSDNQLLAARNIVPGLAFGWSRAEGTTSALAPLPEKPWQRMTELVELTLSNGTTQLLAFSEHDIGAGDLYLWQEQSETWQSVATNYAPMRDRFVHAHRLYWLTGSHIYVYDGSQVQTLTLTPAGGSATAAETAVWAKVEKALAVEQRGQRWFYATADNEIIFSEIGDPARIDPTSIINVEPGPGDRITALTEFNDGLLIFLRDSVYFLRGWELAGGTDVQLSRLNVSSGTAFPGSIQVLENAVLYLGRDGVYRLRLASNTEALLTENISLSRVAAAELSGQSASLAWSAVWHNTYHLSIQRQDSGEPLEYRWYPHHTAFFGPYDHGGWSYARLSDGYLYLGLDGGRIVCLDDACYSYTDSDGGIRPISVRAVTKGFDLGGALARQVKVKKVLLACRQFVEDSSDLTVHLKSDYHDASFDVALVATDESLIYGEGEYGEALWGWKDVVTKELPVNRRAQRVTLTVTDDHAGEPLVFYGLAFLYRVKKVRAERGGVSRVPVDYDD